MPNITKLNYKCKLSLTLKEARNVAQLEMQRGERERWREGDGSKANSRQGVAV